MVAVPPNNRFGAPVNGARVHPYLKSRISAYRYVWAPLMSAVGLVAIWLDIYFDFASYGAAIMFGLLFIWMGLFSSHLYSCWAARANWVLESIPAVPMRISFQSGDALTVNLYAVSDGTCRSFFVEEPRWDLGSYEGTVVQVHMDPDIDDLVLISTSSGIIWPLWQHRRIPTALRKGA